MRTRLRLLGSRCTVAPFQVSWVAALTVRSVVTTCTSKSSIIDSASTRLTLTASTPPHGAAGSVGNDVTIATFIVRLRSGTAPPAAPPALIDDVAVSLRPRSRAQPRIAGPHARRRARRGPDPRARRQKSTRQGSQPSAPAADASGGAPQAPR